MDAKITVDKSLAEAALVQLREAAGDRAAMLAICGELMRTSVARTFREEGSPAGSWPQLAPSTRRDKRYTAGHKLLILSGRLFASISYLVSGDTLTIGTDVVHAAVHQFGSRDWMGGAAGPRTREQVMNIGPYAGLRRVRLGTGKHQVEDRNGRVMLRRARLQGPEAAKPFNVSAHTRRQNIPARPFLVFRPEDPGRLTRGIESYLRGKSVRIGRVGGAA